MDWNQSRRTREGPHAGARPPRLPTLLSWAPRAPPSGLSFISSGESPEPITVPNRPEAPVRPGPRHPDLLASGPIGTSVHHLLDYAGNQRDWGALGEGWGAAAPRRSWERARPALWGEAASSPPSAETDAGSLFTHHQAGRNRGASRDVGERGLSPGGPPGQRPCSGTRPSQGQTPRVQRDKRAPVLNDN